MMGFPGGAVVKNPPDNADLRNTVLSLGQEDPLEKEMATHSNILAWRILWTEEPGGLQSMGSHTIRYDWHDLVRMYATWEAHWKDLRVFQSHRVFQMSSSHHKNPGA